MNIIFPMTGNISYKSDEYIYPKPLISINGTLMIENCFEQFKSLSDRKFLPIISKEDSNKYNLDGVLQQTLLDSNHEIIQINGKTAGALCTCLLAYESLNENEELIIANYDQHLNVDISSVVGNFRENNADFGVITFESAHPKWSFVKLDEDGDITESAEKRPISKNAIAGFYYFKTASIFFKAANNLLVSSSLDKKVFYISESINECILLGFKGKTYNIDSNQYRNFYDSNELKEFIQQSKEDSNTKNYDIYKKTFNYIDAFNSCDRKALEEMFDENSSLFDPKVGLIEGKGSIINFIDKIFSKSNDNLNFQSEVVLVDKNNSCIEFLLTLNGNDPIRGVDMITWQNGKILKIYAYMESNE